MSESLKIGFWNAQGLSILKWNKLIDEFSLFSYDIFFVVETWFVNYDSYSQHPLFFCSSLKPPRSIDQNRDKAGIYCLISKSLRSQVSNIQVDLYSLNITLFGKILSCVYIPPSFKNIIQVSSILPSTSVSLLIGDINTQFGVSFGTKKSGPSERIKLFKEYAPSHSLIHIVPQPPGPTPDHAFVSHELTFDWNFNTNSGLLSDHLPMYGLLHIPVPLLLDKDSDSWKFYLQPLNNPAIIKLMCTAYESNSELLDKVLHYLFNLESNNINIDIDIQHKVDTSYQFFVEYLYTICDKYLGTYSVHKSKSKSNSSKMSSKLLDSLNNSSTRYDATSIFKRSQKYNTKSMINSRNPNISAVDDSVNYFKQVFAPPSCSLTLLNTHQPDKSSSFIDYISKFKHFSKDSIKDSIMKYPRSKTAGNDPLHICILKAFCNSESFLNDLSSLFKYFCHLGYTPSVWNVSNIYPIPKSKDSKTIDCFRPIALTCMFRRMFESCLLKYMNTTSLRKLHPTQAGFRSGFSTVTHSVVSNDCFFINGNKSRPNRIFIDLKQAYDRVIIPILLKKLKDKAIPEQFIRLIDSLFSKCFSTICINGTTSSQFPRLRGLFQGSLLSPMLFNVYIDDLAQDLAKTSTCSTIPSCLLFADDIQLLPINLSHAQSMINILESWCLNNGMEINVSKSAFVGTSSWSLNISNNLLPIADSYKYLGLPTTVNGIDWSEYINSCSQKASKMLKFLQVHGSLWPPIIRLTLFRTFVRSIWEYPAPMMSVSCKSSLLKPLQKIQTESLTWIANTSNHNGRIFQRLLHSVMGIESISVRFDSLRIRFGKHYAVSQMDNPLKVLVRLYTSKYITLKKTSLVYNQIHLAPGFRKFIRINSELPPNEHITLSEYMYNRKIENLSKYYTQTDRIKLISPSSRHPKSAIDISLYIRNKFFSFQAIYWRMSTFLCKSKCPVCLNDFHHTHVSKCLKLQNTDNLFTFETIPQLINQLKLIITKVKPDLLVRSN